MPVGNVEILTVEEFAFLILNIHFFLICKYKVKFYPITGNKRPDGQ